MDQVRYKCGYCGWLFGFNTNFIDHNCFKDYVEDVDHIKIDENYVVTIFEKNPTIVGRKGNLDELLSEAVRNKRALYDFRIPASERTQREMTHRNDIKSTLKTCFENRSKYSSISMNSWYSIR